MSTFAIIETGGKQYKVAPGQKIRIEKIAAQAGETFEFPKVLLVVDGDAVRIGTPYLKGEKVEGKVTRQARERKKIVFKFHSKTRYKKKKGHRQYFTEVEISKI